jgi:hypothetical protein
VGDRSSRREDKRNGSEVAVQELRVNKGHAGRKDRVTVIQQGEVLLQNMTRG